MNLTSKMWRDKIYLDQQPELNEVVRQWCQSLELDNGHVAFDSLEVEPIDCRSRDGFSAASHNHGGFDAVLMTDVGACNGSGSGPDLAEIDRQVQQSYREAARWFRAQNFDGCADLTDDQISYGHLHEIGRGDLAEQLDEVEREWQNSPVYWGVRCMYEGQENGVHTLMIYASGNVSEYYGAHGKGSETKGEWTVRFKTASGLARQLKALTKKVESAF